MAKYNGADAWLIASGYALTGYTTEFSEESEAMLEESHTLGDSWQEFTSVGLAKHSLSQQGYYDDENDGSDEAFTGQQGTSRVICAGVAGQAVSRKFWGYVGSFGAKVTRVASRGALHKINAAFTGTGRKDEGLIHYPLGALSGTSGDGTAVDNTASSSAGGAAYFQVTALVLGGYTNLALKIRHSTDNVTYADLATATVVTAAPAGERVAVNGTVNRYTRANYAYTGAGAGQSATVFMGFSRY